MLYSSTNKLIKVLHNSISTNYLKNLDKKMEIGNFGFDYIDKLRIVVIKAT